MTPSSRFEVAAVLLSAAWLVACATFFLLVPGAFAPLGPPGQFAMTLLAVFLPVAIIWVAAASARTARVLREESARLHAAVEGMRRTALAEARAAGAAEGAARVEQRLDTIEERAIATFASARAKPAPPPPPPEPEPEAQPALDLGQEPAPPPAEMGDLVRALHFPENASDQAGFEALRRVLQDRSRARLIQAAQDILTLLAEDGVYMDELRLGRAEPATWRAFADGMRGEAVAPIGVVRDRAALTLASTRMREDAIFRDAAHHFLRQFDGFLQSFAPEAEDDALAALGATRSARAFSLLGRAAGVFDAPTPRG